MVTGVSSTPSKKLLKWQTGYIWLLWRFRNFVRLEAEAAKAKDDGMKRHWWNKRSHIHKKIQEHEECAPEEIQVKEFTEIVLGMIAQNKNPKQILVELDHNKTKKDESPPSSPCRLRLARFRTSGSHPENHGFKSRRRHNRQRSF
jgi:hypothetical protein